MPNIVESRDEQYDELIASLVKWFEYRESNFEDVKYCTFCFYQYPFHEKDCPVAIVKRQTSIKLGEENDG